MEETATSEIFLKLTEEPGPTPTPDPGPVDPGDFISNVATGDPIAILLLVLCVVALLALICFSVYVGKRAYRQKRILADEKFDGQLRAKGW